MFDPIKSSQNIKDQFVDYLSTDFRFGNERIQQKYRDELDKTISQGPFLEINDVYETSLSINDLIDCNVLSEKFRDLEKDKKASYSKVLPLDRPLYVHQVEAIKQIVAGSNVVISTGTGSGKTNCFLIPVINELLKEEEEGTLGPGIRAIFIFPMNALANDQIKNVRKLLMNYPSITFGVYNGGTEQTDTRAEDLYNSTFMNDEYEELRTHLPNELVSRDQMKDNPPNILFTNYAMLEHLLLRPADDVLFSQSDFKFVVLDEAHIYTGATGIETSILMRRLKARIHSTTKTQFILTSATLSGSGVDAKSDIIDFANKLTGEEFYSENVIRSTRKVISLDKGSLKKYPKKLFNELADESNNVSEILDKYDIKHAQNEDESELIYDFLLTSELYSVFREKTAEIQTLDEIRNRLILSYQDIDDQTLISLISLCGRARKCNSSLIDARYHFFIRTLEGAYMTLPYNENSDLSLVPTETFYDEETHEKRRMFEVALCNNCESLAVVGQIVNGYLVNSKKIDDKSLYFVSAETANNDFCDDDETEVVASGKDKTYCLCTKCGAICEDGCPSKCQCEEPQFIKLILVDPINDDDIPCKKCHSGRFKRLYLGDEGTTSELAMSLFEELPEISYEQTPGDDKTRKTGTPFDVVLSGKSSKKKSNSSYGQFLAFSDSRQEAAKFATDLEHSYHEFLGRRGICHIIKMNKENDPYFTKTKTIQDYCSSLAAYFDNKGCFESEYFDEQASSITNAYVAMIDELARYNENNSLVSLGFLQFTYLGNENLIENTTFVEESLSAYPGATAQSIKDLLNILFLEIVKNGAICADDDSYLSSREREYIFYSKKQRYIELNCQHDKDPNVTHWLPKKHSGFSNRRMFYVKKALGLSNDDLGDKAAIDFLSGYFQYLIDSNVNPYHLVSKTGSQVYALETKNIAVHIAGDPKIKWYRCPKCGKLQLNLLNGRCSIPECQCLIGEKDDEIKNTAILSKDNHFAKFYSEKERMVPMVVKEHTAQLNKSRSLEYQKAFIEKDINVLSCSTTFELGVDIGDLNAVFLRNMPPTPANYNQRAGRAGRSLNSVAYVLCFAKLNSHDMYFFNRPTEMIKGTIAPPYFNLENEKIARRHINAVALSSFLKEYPYIYNYNDAKIFLNGDPSKNISTGYSVFVDWLDLKRRTNDKALKDLLLESIPGSDDFHHLLGLHDYSWIDKLVGPEGSLSKLMDTYYKNIEEFDEIILKLENEKNENVSGDSDIDNKINQYKKNKYGYMKNQFIDFLARGNILPKYGFPVDTVELEENHSSDVFEDLNLDRDLQIAVSEYAPSSEVIANGKMYTSRYIKRMVQETEYTWKKATIAICPQCGQCNYSEVTSSTRHLTCITCGADIDPSKDEVYTSILPNAGFITDKEVKPVPLKRPERNFSTPIYYIGDGQEIGSTVVEMNGKSILIESTTDDSLLVRSSDFFYVCEKCGYAVSRTEDAPFGKDRSANAKAKNGVPYITTDRSHENSKGFECDCRDFEKYALHQSFKTDVAKITFCDCETMDHSTLLSVAYALYNAIIYTLQIDSKDLSVTLSIKKDRSRFIDSIIIFDRTPGGSGYSRKLIENNGEQFKDVVKVAYENMKNCDCDPSCYNCLRSYENRNFHDELDRKKAMTFLEQFIN